MKPDPQLPRDFQARESFVIRPTEFVCRPVARHSQLVEQIADLARRDPLEIQPPQQVRLRFIG
jgi:hypothetical protein